MAVIIDVLKQLGSVCMRIQRICQKERISPLRTTDWRRPPSRHVKSRIYKDRDFEICCCKTNSSMLCSQRFLNGQ